jgi:two-component system, NtrC family, sensor kinase
VVASCSRIRHSAAISTGSRSAASRSASARDGTVGNDAGSPAASSSRSGTPTDAAKALRADCTPPRAWIATPLGVITARADQLAARAGTDERGDRAVRVILEQTARIEQVIRAFLALARGDAPAARAVDPVGIAAGARALVAHRFARAGVSLATAAPAPVPTVHGEARLLEHALVNLLLNACDASPRGSTVEMQVASDEGNVVFTVSDAGAGISPDDVARVTEPFFTTKPDGAGTGLGLAIVNEIVKHHPGALTFTPREPRGTVVRMSIPSGERRNA